MPGSQASGTQVPSTQAFPAPQKSAQVFEEEVQAASPERSSAASRLVLAFKFGSFPDGMTGPRPFAALVGGPLQSTARTNDVGDFTQPDSGPGITGSGQVTHSRAAWGVHLGPGDETIDVQR